MGVLRGGISCLAAFGQMRLEGQLWSGARVGWGDTPSLQRGSVGAGDSSMVRALAICGEAGRDGTPRGWVRGGQPSRMGGRGDIWECRQELGP